MIHFKRKMVKLNFWCSENKIFKTIILYCKSKKAILKWILIFHNISSNFGTSVEIIIKSLHCSKPNYFKNRHFHSYLPEVNRQVQNGHGVLSRLLLCLKCMELACRVLMAISNLYIHFRKVEMMMKNVASWLNLALAY